MMKNTITKRYNRNGEEIEFNFTDSMSVSEKMSFVRYVTGTVVDDNNYDCVLKDLIFNYAVIVYFTDVDVSYIKESANMIDDIEELLFETNIVEIVKDNMLYGLWDELYDAVDNQIAYKTGIHNDPMSVEFARLIETVTKKIESVDISEIMSGVKGLTELNESLTPNKILDAYANNKDFKKKVIEMNKNMKK